MKTVRNSILLMLFLIVVFLTLAARCFYLQFFKADHYRKASLMQLQRQKLQTPQRGVILDRRGVVLAASNKMQTIFADPKIIDDPEVVAAKLAPILDMTLSQIRDLITKRKNSRFVKLKVNATANICAAANKTHPGINTISTWQRVYPSSTLTSHIVGFTGKDNTPYGGIESQYDKYLKGSPGKDTFLIDNRRNPIRLKEQNAPLTDGSGIILTIDAAIQQFTHEALYKQYKDFQAQSATAIVADPKTGEILALVSMPDFDPDKTSTTKPDYFRNRAITDPFEPGSILKPFTVAIALDCGTITTNQKIFCESGNFHGRGFGRINEYRGHGFGNLTHDENLIPLFYQSLYQVRPNHSGATGYQNLSH